MSLTVHRLSSVKDALKKLKKLNQFQFKFILIFWYFMLSNFFIYFRKIFI